MSDQVSYSVPQAAAKTGLSESHLKAAIRRDDLLAFKSGVDANGMPAGKWLILPDDLTAYVERLRDRSVA